MSYKVTVTEQPARRLVGLCARVNLSESHKECPVLYWQDGDPVMLYIPLK